MSFILWPPNVSEIRTIISLSIFSSSSTVFVHNISDIYFSYKRQLRQLLCLNDWFRHPRFFVQGVVLLNTIFFPFPIPSSKSFQCQTIIQIFNRFGSRFYNLPVTFCFTQHIHLDFQNMKKKETSILKGFLFSFSNAEDGTWTHTLAMSTRSLVLLVCQFRHFRMSVISRDDFLIIAKKNKKVNHFFQKNCKKFFIQLKQFFQKKSWLIL